MARPNVLFLMTDQQRFNTIGALGSPHVHTPNLAVCRMSDDGFECHPQAPFA